MARCQHCKKLTHSEHLYVEYDVSQQNQVDELSESLGWKPSSEYILSSQVKPNEYGRLKCGDIYIHFIVKSHIIVKSKKECHG